MQEISPDINHAEGDEHKGAVESDRPEESPGDDAQNESPRFHSELTTED
jgi:hypothetical protein